MSRARSGWVCATMLVCHCAVVNDRRIAEVIDAGASDLLEVAGACGAGSFCGGCQPTITTLLSERTGRPVGDFEEVRTATPASPSVVQPGQRAFRTVVRAIEEDVLAAGWHRGQPLGTRDELAAGYACTRGTLDRAAWVLEQHGIVRYELTGAGALHVGIPDPRRVAEAAALHLRAAGAELDQLVAARRLVESTLARLAARRRDPDAVARLRAWLDDDHDAADAATAAVDFHVLIAEGSGNPALRIVSETLTHAARLLVGAVLSTDSPELRRLTARFVAEVDEEHRVLAAAVMAGREDEAAEVMSHHIETFYTRLLASEPDRRPPAAPRPEDPASPVRVAQAVAQEISARGIAPGGLLAERRELLRRYGTDRETLRRAATLLEYYAVAHERPGQAGGLVVLSPDPWPTTQLLAMYLDEAEVSAAELFEVRGPFERAAVEQATQHAGPAEIALLRRRREEEQATWNDERGAMAGEWGFHDLHVVLGEISGDPVLRLVVGACQLATVRGAGRWHATGPTQDVRRAFDADHDRLVDAVASGATDRAGTTLTDHLERLRRTYLP